MEDMTTGGQDRTPTLLSVNVGMPKDVSWHDKTVYTGVWKEPVAGPQMVRRLNIDGDGQGDKQGHGGEQRAVLVYQADSVRHWRRYFGRDDIEFGHFGENLTVDGLPDDEVCIGARYRIGAAEFEVTQPRVTCYRVGLRLGEPELPALLVSHHRPGFYMRVLREGRIRAGDRIVKTRTGPGALSVAEADALLYLPGRDRAKRRVATQIPALSPGWQQSFRDLLAGSDAPAAAEPAWAGFRPLRVSKVVPESAYICGPASFMTDMRDALSAAGVDPARIHTELFGALASINPGLTGQAARSPHQPPGPAGTGPMVTFARSGITTRFGGAGRSLLELADACDVPTRWSCRSGVCRTCTTPLLSGAVSYAPDPLEPPANGEVLICCAQPSADVVLDM